MFCWLLLLIFSGSFSWTPAVGRVIQKRAAFYIANETMCIVDGEIYRNGDPVPTDDECERCTCRPPGFSCVLRDCETKPGCKAVRKIGECCPEYVCGCVHNSRLYEDGELIRDLQNNCYTCRCHGSSISCTFADCHFRGDCPPEYIPGECCPRYDHCPPASTTTTTTTTTTQATTPAIVQQEIEFFNMTTQHLEKFTSEDTTVTIQDIVTGDSQFTTSSDITAQETLFSVKFTLSGETISSIKDYDEEELTTILPRHTVGYKETTKHIITAPGSELTSLKFGLAAGDFETTTPATSSSESETHFPVTAQPDVVFDTESTTEYADSHSQAIEVSSTTESGPPEELTGLDSGISDSESVFVTTTTYEDKIATVKEPEASTFDSDSRLHSTEKYGSSSESLLPVFVPEEEDANETTTHEQDSHLQTELEVSTSTEDNSSHVSDHSPVPSHEKETTLSEYSEVSTSDKILVADSFDSKSVLAHTDNATESEITTEESEKHESTELTAAIDIQTSDDADLLSHTSHSTTLDSDDLQTVSDHSELDKESTTDINTDDGEISHAPTQVDTFEDSTDHELKPTSTVSTEEFVTAHDDSENGTSSEHEHTSDSHSDSHTDIDSTDGYNSELNTSVTHETASDFPLEISESSLHPSETTHILDLQSTSDIGTSTDSIADISDTEEVSNDTVGTEVHTDDHTYSEETGSTDTHIDKTTANLHITSEDTSDAVSQNDLFSTDITTISDHHLSSDQGLTSTFPENQPTISELFSVSSEEDLTTGAESVAEETTTGSNAVDIHSQSTELLEVGDKGTTGDLGSSESTEVTSDDLNTSVDEEASASESEDDVTELVDSSQEFEENVSRLPTSEHSESEDSSVPSVSTDGELTSHKGTDTDEDTSIVTVETLKSSTLSSADSEISDHVPDREQPTASVPTTDSDTEEYGKIHSVDDEKEELETKTSSDYQSTFGTTSETHDQTADSIEQSSEPGESVDLHTNLPESSESEMTTLSQEISSHAESEDSSQEEEISNEEIESTKDIDEVTSSSDTTTSSDFPSKATDLSSQSTTEEIKSEESHTDALHVKHDIPLLATQSTTVTTSGSEHTSTTTENDIPSEIPAFEPPLANILKQSMLFQRPTVASESTPVSLLSGDVQNDKTNSSDENEFVRLSLTLAGDDKDSNATLIHEDSENKIFVLNHEYTISDAEVNNIGTDENDTEFSSEHSEDSLSSVTDESEHLETVSTEQGTSSEYPSTAKDHDINPNPFYSDKDDSISSISETEVQHSELSTETTETENLTHGHINDLNLLSENLDSEALSQDNNYPNASNAQHIDGNLSEETSTINSHTTSFPEITDITENPTSESEHENENIVTNANLLVSTDTATNFETTENEDSETSHVNNEDQELLTKSQASADTHHESTTEKDYSDATADDEGVGSEAIEHTVASSDDEDKNDDHDDHYEETDDTNEDNSESNFDHSDPVTNDSLNTTNFSEEDKEKHNVTDVDYSYHDAETAESSEEDKETHTMSLSSLDAEMITALQEIGTSLIGNISDIDNSSFSVNTEYNYASTTQADGGSDTPSTVQINVLFGQDSYSSNTETAKNDIYVTKIKHDSSQDSGDENNFHYTGTDEPVLDEESGTFTHSEGLEEIHSHADNTETAYTTVSQSEDEEVSETEVYSHENLNITSDTSETPKLEENVDHKPELSTQFNEDFSDETTSTDVSSTVDSHDAEEISSPFTILEYIGDLFSGVSTFSTVSDTSEGHTNEEATETSENDTKSTPLADSTTENENMTLSLQETYSSILKNQFAEYGSLGGVFITGQSKYNKSTSDEESHDHTNEPDGNLNSSDVTEDGADLLHLNSDIQINAEVHTVSENVHSDSEESNHDSEFISTVEVHQQSTTTDDAVTADTEHVEEKSSVEPGALSTEETLTTILDIKTEEGPEKGGEWFIPLDSDSNHEEDGKEQSISTDTETDNTVTTEIPEHHGPEKGGEVFEPSFPELFPLGSATSHTSIDNLSENTDEEHTVTESVTKPSYSVIEETETSVSTQSNVINTTKVPSGLPDSNSETSTDGHFKSQFVPPLPILLKDLGKSNRHNDSHSRDSEDTQNEEKSKSGGNEEESSKNISKFEYARNIRHPFPLSDIIAQVFKAPGYDSEVHLSPLTGSVPSKKSQLFRLKRDLKIVPGEGIPDRKEEFSTYAPSGSNHASSSSEDADPFKTKHILHVEGYGHKPAGFFPVTSTFIFVHSDEENETGDESKKKIAKGGDPEIEYLDEIPFESLEKEVSLSGVGKTHQTK